MRKKLREENILFQTQHIYIQGYHSFAAVKTGKCDDLLAKELVLYSSTSFKGYKQSYRFIFFTHESSYGSNAKAIFAFMDKYGAQCVAYNSVYDEVAVLDQGGNLQIQEDVSALGL